jgi:hypothetical protein
MERAFYGHLEHNFGNPPSEAACPLRRARERMVSI